MVLLITTLLLIVVVASIIILLTTFTLISSVVVVVILLRLVTSRVVSVVTLTLTLIITNLSSFSLYIYSLFDTLAFFTLFLTLLIALLSWTSRVVYRTKVNLTNDLKLNTHIRGRRTIHTIISLSFCLRLLYDYRTLFLDFLFWSLDLSRLDRFTLLLFLLRLCWSLNFSRLHLFSLNLDFLRLFLLGLSFCLRLFFLRSFHIIDIPKNSQTTLRLLFFSFWFLGFALWLFLRLIL